MSAKEMVISLCSALVGIGAMLCFRSMPAVYFTNSDSYDFAWEKTIVPVVAIFSLVFGAIEPKVPWRWPLIIMTVHYFSGFALMTNWGQIPPFEIAYCAVLALPGLTTAYIGAFLRRRFEDAT